MLTTGEIPMKTDFEQVDSGNKKRLILYNGEYVDDFILDDQAVIYKSEKGLVVIAGCAHRGIINTVLHAQNITGIKDVFAVIGGSHLVDSNTERIVNTMKALEELKVKKIGLCHCTGFKALSMLYNMFPEQFITVNAGTEILFFNTYFLTFRASSSSWKYSLQIRMNSIEIWERFCVEL